MKKKQAAIIFIIYFLIIATTASAVFISGRSYPLYISNPTETDDFEITYSEEGIVSHSPVTTKNGISKVVFTGLKKGTVEIQTKYYPESGNKKVNTTYYTTLKVTSSGFTLISGYDFGGYQFICMGFVLLTLTSFIVFTKQFIYRKKNQFFSYKTVLDLAMMFYFGTQFIVFAGMFSLCIIMPDRFDSVKMYDFAGLIMSIIFMVFTPLIVVFSAFLCISNLSLIRREGFRVNNLLGIMISTLLAIGSLACIVSAYLSPQSTYGEIDDIKYSVLRCTVSSIFVYFIFLLLAAMVCCIYAGSHKPKYNQDYIIILGCKIKKDGTPLPLLRGRIDKALDFYNAQLAQTGKQACFVPSGGKGSDEVISEAQSMKNYLIEKGIDESIIFPETESATTMQNMKFSDKIISSKKKDANILFATTNYHVFRSGILSVSAGMKADGIGAKTKWYFWPNAQIREFIGLIVKEWKTNLLFVVSAVILSVVTANLGTILNLLFK